MCYKFRACSKWAQHILDRYLLTYHHTPVAGSSEILNSSCRPVCARSHFLSCSCHCLCFPSLSCWYFSQCFGYTVSHCCLQEQVVIACANMLTARRKDLPKQRCQKPLQKVWDIFFSTEIGLIFLVWDKSSHWEGCLPSRCQILNQG